MTSGILIAYNNDTSVELHDFLESCGDTVRQYCFDNNIAYTTLVPPDLTDSRVSAAMENHKVCFVASHGDYDGLYNENDSDVITTRTVNYNFQDKALYCVSCYSAVRLCPCLMQIGLKLFVGYNDTFEVRGDYTPFLQSALSGIICLLEGNDIKTAKDTMNQVYDEQIDKTQKENLWAALSLLHNKEALVFLGEDDYRLG